jgi:hypothetical protein
MIHRISIPPMLLGIVAFAAASGLEAQQNNEASKSEEYLLLGSVNRGAGEPIIFVNPKDHDNIIVAAMATLNRLPGGETPILPRGTQAAIDLRIKELSTPDGSRTDIAVTRDGGKTWDISQDHFRTQLDKNRCSDSFSGAGPDGKLYVGCLAYLARGSADYADGYDPKNGEARDYHGGSAIAWSYDKGRTWSFPTWVHPGHSPSLYAPTVHPVFEQASPWDRPMFVADAQKGTIYLSGSGPAYTVDPATVQRPKVDQSLGGAKGYTGYPGNDISRSRTFIRASHDGGYTWGVIYPMDSDEYAGGRGGYSAAHGHLVVAYGAAKVPAKESIQCPCTVFGTSDDDGKTFAYRVVPPLPPATAAAAGGRGGRGGFGGGAMLGADPSKDGRYAMARQSGNALYVSVTQDGGKTWGQPVLAVDLPQGANFGQRAMKYGPNGDLGIIWKQMYADRSYDVWSSVMRAGASSFKTVRVSHAVSPPYIPDRGNFMFGDDLSSVDLDDRYLHVVWGDNRSGFEATWYGRVPLEAYQ